MKVSVSRPRTWRRALVAVIGLSLVLPSATAAAGPRYVVRTSGRRPGETETIPFTLAAGSPGDSTVTAVMHSPLVPGQTVVRVPIHVHA